MITPELKSYVEGELGKGVSKETIKSLLLQNGWAPEDVEDVFASAAASFVPPLMPASKPEPLAQAIIAPARKIGTFGKKILPAVIIIAIVFIAGGGAYAYFSGAFLSLPRVASQAFESARTASSFKSDMTVTVDLSEAAGATEGLELFTGSIDSSTLKLTVKSAQDFGNPENIKSTATVAFTLGSLYAAGEYRILDKTLYAVITKAPALGGMLPMFSSFENKWVSFPLSSADNEDLRDTAVIKSPLSFGFQDKLTAEQQEYVLKLFREAHLVTTVKKLPPEKINGNLSYHFVFDLDREGINAYLDELEEYVREAGKNDSELSIFSTAKIKEELGKIGNFQGEVWIGQRDKLPYKLMLDFDMYGAAGDSAEKVKVSAVSIFDGWNEPVLVAAPAESVPFEQFLSGMMSGALLPVEEDGPDISE